MPFVIFFLRLQSQIAVWALKHMRACLIRGQGINLQVWALFVVTPPRASFVKLAD